MTIAGPNSRFRKVTAFMVGRRCASYCSNARSGVAALGKRKRENARIDDCLAAGLSAGRPHRMSRIAEQRHPTEAPSRQRVAIRLGIFVDFVGSADQVGKIKPTEIPVLEGLDDQIIGDLAVPGRISPEATAGTTTTQLIRERPLSAAFLLIG